MASKQAWMDKIIKEYRGRKSPEDFYHQIGEGVLVHPYHHSEDEVPSNTLGSFPQSLSLILRLNLDTDESTFVDYLNLGLSGAVMPGENARIMKEWNTVHWEMLDLYFLGKPCTEQKLTSNVKPGNEWIKADWRPLDVSAYYHNQVEERTFLRESIRAVNSGVVVIRLGDLPLFQMAALRAIRLFSESKERPIRILAVPSLTGKREKNLIRLTTMAITARLGGADALVLENEDDAYYRMMIPRLMEEESYLSEISDPLEGSYYIEYIASQMLQALMKA